MGFEDCVRVVIETALWGLIEEEKECYCCCRDG